MEKTKRQGTDFFFEVMPDFGDNILEEGANTAICCRKISWNGREPKVDIRKYNYKEGGEEVMGKGISLTDDGADELVHVLTANGYGDTNTIINNIMGRQDFLKLEKGSNDKQLDDEPEEYYDPSELID